MLSDKKNREGKIKFVLPADTGSILIDVEADKNDVLYSLSKTKEILS
jgi:3-dehydroquinate synthetase